MFKPFRYAGNKSKYFKFYRELPADTKRIVEPFAGSLIFSMQYDLPILASDIEPRIVELYNWLASISEIDLHKLNNWYLNKRDNFDIRDITILSEPQRTYIKLNAGSMMTGHIDKNIIYRNAKSLPIDNTIACLPKIKNQLTILNVEFDSLEIKSGDLIFIDPPYIGSHNQYGRDIDENDLVNRIKQFISKYPDNKFIFTHADGVEYLFPDYDWQFTKEHTLIKSRIKTQSRVRNEYVAYINW